MYLLDNDTFSHILRGNVKVAAMLRATPVSEIWLSSIAVEETIKGYQKVIHDEYSKKRFGFEAVYRDLIVALNVISEYQVKLYTNEAHALYKSWRPGLKRVGDADCKTAALAIVSDMTVVTCNQKDFSALSARFVDWSK